MRRPSAARPHARAAGRRAVAVRTVALELLTAAAAPPRWWRGRKRLGRPPGWRIVNSGTGRAGGGCPSCRGSDARISGRCTGPSSSSRFPSASSSSSASSAARASSACVSASDRRRYDVDRPRRRRQASRPPASLTLSSDVRRLARARRSAPLAGAPRARRASGRSRATCAYSAAGESRSCGAGAAPSRACIRARRRTWCSASASRRRRSSRRRRGSSAAARADSNRPECHQAEAGAAASKSPDGSSLAGKEVRKASAILAELVSRWQ